jgi:hypothetical protein
MLAAGAVATAALLGAAGRLAAAGRLIGWPGRSTVDDPATAVPVAG